jgi:hypothetical protein
MTSFAVEKRLLALLGMTGYCGAWRSPDAVLQVASAFGGGESTWVRNGSAGPGGVVGRG